MFLATLWCLLALAMTSQAERWRWPEGAQSVRIDTKVRFIDSGADDAGATNDKNRDKNVQSDEPPFEQPSDTVGFYNRPPGAGRYPVRVEPHNAPYRVDTSSVYPGRNQQGRRQFYDSDGTLDSLQYCKCVSTPDCNPRADSNQACGSGKFLCCYKKPNQVSSQNSGDAVGYGHFGPNRPDVLVGPDGPTGQLGPDNAHLLINHESPDSDIGPNGNIGPKGPIYSQHKTPVLVGPGGPTGVIGPGPVNRNPRPDAGQSESAQRGVLVGPGGPTGFIGPYGQRPILTGPGGPTGIIGPRGGRRGVLSGPGGPTGIIGPGYGRQSGPGLLVGPGGPTGIIGPGRPLLVGPGGPTGIIGPRYFEKPQCRRDEKNLQKTTPTAHLGHEVVHEHTNPSTRIHHIGPARPKRSLTARDLWVKPATSKQGQLVSSLRQEPINIRNIRVGALRSKRELQSIRWIHLDTVPRLKRAPKRTRLRKPKYRYRKSHGDEATAATIRTTTRKKITDKDRIPVFMFMIKVFEYVLRILG